MVESRPSRRFPPGVSAMGGKRTLPRGVDRQEILFFRKTALGGKQSLRRGIGGSNRQHPLPLSGVQCSRTQGRGVLRTLHLVNFELSACRRVELRESSV